MGKIPKEWGVIKFGDVCHYKKGKKPAKVQIINSNGFLPYLSTQYLRENGSHNFAALSKDVITVNKNDLVLLWDGSNAGEFFQGKKGILSSTMVRIQFKEEVFKVRFLFYLLKTMEPYIKCQTKGTGIPHVDGNVLDRLVLPTPKPAEQEKIADVLGVADSAIELADQVIAKTERLKKGLMRQLLTHGIGHTEYKQTPIGKIPKDWMVTKIGDFAKLKSGGTPRRDAKEYWTNGKIPWLKSGELNDGEIIYCEEKINEIGLKNSAARIFPKGTLLMAMYGKGTVTKTGVLGIDSTSKSSRVRVYTQAGRHQSQIRAILLNFQAQSSF